ncbi:MAG TPA: TolC family protein, partial [Gemmatimonadaceae bacterium]|nr:TolC family protein [Gemmatimonadaceae bacterium]
MRGRVIGFVALCGAPALCGAQSRLSGVLGGPNADTMRLDLEGSVQLALQNATAIQVGSDSVRLGGITLLEAYGRFLPNVTTTFGGFGEVGNTLLSATSLTPADAQFYGMGYQLMSSVNVFNGFRDREHMRSSAALRDAASDGLDRAKQQVGFDVTQAFYQVVLDQRLRAVAAANLDLSRAREAQLADEVRIGTRAPPDLYRQQAQAAADQVALIDADN